MSSSKSSPTNTTATTTNASETNQAATNTQGVTLVGNKGVTLTSSTTTTNNSTDDGAVLAGTKLASQAISANTGLSEALAGDYMTDVSNSNTASASLVSNVLTQGIQFLTTEQANNAALASSAETSAQTNLADTATALSNIATANDTTQASQSTAFATDALKIAAVVILGVAVIYFATKQG